MKSFQIILEIYNIYPSSLATCSGCLEMLGLCERYHHQWNQNSKKRIPWMTKHVDSTVCMKTYFMHLLPWVVFVLDEQISPLTSTPVRALTAESLLELKMCSVCWEVKAKGQILTKIKLKLGQIKLFCSTVHYCIGSSHQMMGKL